MPAGNFVKSIFGRNSNSKAVGNVGGPLDYAQSLVTGVGQSLVGNLIGKNKLASFAFSEKGIAARIKTSGLSGLLKLSWCGLNPLDNTVPSDYVVRIGSINSDKNDAMSIVYAAMQEKVTLKATSEWAPLIPMGALSQINMASQALGNKALLNTFMTRRMWRGTSPIQITLNLVFEARENARRNVVMPVIKLMKLCLPSQASDGLMMTPPGPSPFVLSDSQIESVAGSSGNLASALNNKLDQVVGASVKTGLTNLKAKAYKGTTISVSLGQLVNFDSVIIDEVSPTFDMTRVDVDGNPMGAKVALTFSTYEVYTQESLKMAFVAGKTNMADYSGGVD